MVRMYLIIYAAVMMVSCNAEEVQSPTETKSKEASLNPIENEVNLENSKENTYRLFSFQIGENFVSMSPLPGKVNLLEDIATIKSNGVNNVVTLVSKEELIEKNLHSFMDEMSTAGIEVYHSPIVDFGLPSQGQMDSIMSYIQNCLDSNKNVLIHCMGGYGRSGTVMGCYASKYLDVDDPLQYVRDVRGADAIETTEQETFILNY